MWAYYQRQIPLRALFIDFKKVLDSIDREMMWKILRNHRTPKKMVTTIAVIYSSSKSRVKLEDELSKAFHNTTSVLQGDTLAHFLLIIVLGYVLKQTDPNYGIKTNRPNSDASLPDLDFAW